MASVYNMDDACVGIGTAISTVLKEIKPISISINWNFPSTCILPLFFLSLRSHDHSSYTASLGLTQNYK